MRRGARLVLNSQEQVVHRFLKGSFEKIGNGDDY
jgi:hypothetical protein